MRIKRGLAFILALVMVFATLQVASAATSKKSEVVSEAKSKITIAAAASLKDVTVELQKEFNKAYPNIALTFTYGASGALKNQIINGAPVDVFISAGVEQMDALDDAKLLLAGTRKNLLTNTLVLVIPKDSKLKIKSFADAVKSDKVKLIAIGDLKSVPAGQYAKQVFDSLNLWDQASKKINYATDVRQVLTWVESGDVDCGVVYGSDALVGEVKVICTASSKDHEPIIYPVAAIGSTKVPNASKLFIKFLSTKKAVKIFKEYGFGQAKNK